MLIDFESDIRPRLNKYPQIVRDRVDKVDLANDWSVLAIKDVNGKEIGWYFPHPKTLPVFADSTIAEQKAVQESSMEGNWAYPHFHALDGRYLQFVDELLQAWTDAIPSKIESDGAPDENGIVSDFYGGYHLGGISASPPPMPLYDNSRWRESLDLSNDGFEGWRNALYGSVIRVCLEEVDAVGYPIKYGKSRSAPHFDTSVFGKRDDFNAAVRDYDIASDYLANGRIEEARDGFGYYQAISNVYRDQSSDKYDMEKELSKDRPTWSEDLVAGFTTDTDIMDKKGPAKKAAELFDPSLLSDKSFKRFCAMRKRVANGTPTLPNVAMAVFWNGVLQSMMRRFGFTYHDTGPASKEVLVAKSDSIGAFDVSSHDLLWPVQALERICEEMKSMGFPDSIILHFNSTMRAPRYAANLDGETSGVLIGDWDVNNPIGGLISGHYATTPVGCINMTYEYFQAMIDKCAPHMIDVYESGGKTDQDELTRSILRGEKEIMFKIKSDDCLVGATGVAAKYLDKIIESEMKEEGSANLSNTMILGFENGFKYLGDLICRTPTSHILQPDIVAIGVRLVTDEFSTVPIHMLTDKDVERRCSNLDRSRKKFPGIGSKARLDMIRKNVYKGNLLIEIINNLFNKHFGQTYENYVEALYKVDEINLPLYVDYLIKKRALDASLRFDAHNLSTNEAIFLMDDSKQYSYIDINSIRPEIVELSASPSIPSDDGDYLELYHKIVPFGMRGINKLMENNDVRSQ